MVQYFGCAKRIITRIFDIKVPFSVHAGKYLLSGVISRGDFFRTAALLASLNNSDEGDVRIEIDMSNFMPDKNFAEKFDPEELARIMDASPTRRFAFSIGEWSEEHSVVLATRPYPIELDLGEIAAAHSGIEFSDLGTAFVEALETRQSSFGSLSLIDREEYEMPFSVANLKRLLRLDCYFEKLALPTFYDDFAECVLLPFSANTNALEYSIDSNSIEPDDFKSLDIPPKDLSLKIYVGGDDDGDNWDDFSISFLNRVTELGHFEKLNIAIISWHQFVSEKVEAVTNALVSAIKANPRLVHLDLSNSKWSFDWNPQVQHIFEAAAEHPGLRTLVVEKYPPNDPNYSWLRLLLSRNLYITVLDRSGNKCTDGSSIDRLYLLNKCYIDSSTLLRESASLRPSLVAKLLIQGAPEKYKRNQVLLSQQMDVLCEFIQAINHEDNVALVSAPEESEFPSSLRRNSSQRAHKRLRSSLEY
ncbi:hypothetical protein FisN_7Hu106 [Fistulifera solaris]|uniref:Uncharacterized protein n=1 Tax=Fistulifera solaris TaxID=1519565 RepID=A0A1Z5K3G3_FISSO|nr:hypothetical protein FisN_7Hu106 [Fistulifera solaris]|eukprot:GAX20794.1 hypothetical protein FisN_7Hu106 [Fistulifera solaris]